MKKIAVWLPALAWMGVIFFMSAMPGEVSGEQSGRIAALVMSAADFLLGDGAAALSPDLINLLVRKCAHMAEYAVLFVLYCFALTRSGARRPGLTALCLCAAYAATDEGHQAFVAGRGPSIVDVGIDTLGAFAAWGVWGAAARLCGKRTSRRTGHEAV